ncbi:hypothetical protein F4808DRAFT_476231 [Astrocystis sublimbata]|nr:hypothetical protein F4808DRAFT_476231 [Astrocystis sublimbata]
MHERGACPCPVEFPELLGPRIIQRSSIVSAENRATGGNEESGGVGADHGSSPYQSTSFRVGDHGNRQLAKKSYGRNQEEYSELPLFKEAQIGKSFEVAIRQPSLYAAEWTKDHAKLHERGRCSCPVSFERYKPLDIGTIEEEYDSPKSIQMRKDTIGSDPFVETGLRVHENAYSTVRSEDTTGAKPASRDENPFKHENPLWNFTRISPGKIARWNMDNPNGSLLDTILGPVKNGASAPGYGNRPVDVQTIHYESNGLPIAGSPIVCGSYSKDEGQALSIVDFDQPDATIAGFPIGAGPEGHSHAKDFASCSLKSTSSESCSEDWSPIMKRRLSSEF